MTNSVDFKGKITFFIRGSYIFHVFIIDKNDRNRIKYIMPSPKGNITVLMEVTKNKETPTRNISGDLLYLVRRIEELTYTADSEFGLSSENRNFYFIEYNRPLSFTTKEVLFRFPPNKFFELLNDNFLEFFMQEFNPFLLRLGFNKFKDKIDTSDRKMAKEYLEKSNYLFQKYGVKRYVKNANVER